MTYTNLPLGWNDEWRGPDPDATWAWSRFVLGTSLPPAVSVHDQTLSVPRSLPMTYLPAGSNKVWWGCGASWRPVFGPWPWTANTSVAGPTPPLARIGSTLQFAPLWLPTSVYLPEGSTIT